LTSLFEAIACEAPVVVSESTGIIDRLIADGLVIGVPVADPDAVRDAVEAVLADPNQAARRAVAARKVLLERYSSDAFLDRLDDMLQDVVSTADR
jgi:glycosyltransferase involved in cell wall biosynthesis